MSKEMQLIEKSIRDIHDFPKPGIVFKDITTLLNDAVAYKTLMNLLFERYKEYDLDFIAGIDARGFIFGAALAQMLGIGFVPVRKKGKLPSTTMSQKYSLEYGFDEVEIHVDAFRGKKNAQVLLMDDLIATGGTAKAAVDLINQTEALCVECCFIINIEALGGVEKLQAPCFSVLKV